MKAANVSAQARQQDGSGPECIIDDFPSQPTDVMRLPTASERPEYGKDVCCSSLGECDVNDATNSERIPEREALLDETILRLVNARGSARTVCPSEVAREIAGADEKRWRLLMKPVRERAVRLAKAGRIEIRRKGKTVDPDAFKGIYRLALPSPDS